MLFFTGAFGVKPYIVSGISMEPDFSEGDVAVVRSVDPASLRVDDVVRFSERGRPVVHRIVAIEGTADELVFVTQGDNVRSPDAPIGADQIEGKVVLRIPQIGKLKLWLSG